MRRCGWRLFRFGTDMQFERCKSTWSDFDIADPDPAVDFWAWSDIDRDLNLCGTDNANGEHIAIHTVIRRFESEHSRIVRRPLRRIRRIKSEFVTASVVKIRRKLQIKHPGRMDHLRDQWNTCDVMAVLWRLSNVLRAIAIDADYEWNVQPFIMASAFSKVAWSDLMHVTDPYGAIGTSRGRLANQVANNAVRLTTRGSGLTTANLTGVA